MAARKLQQEVDKCFKKVAEGVVEFKFIYEKIEQSGNPAQKEKLEVDLKRVIKKLQRLRDQIKSWAASNDIKDKGPLLDQRRLIEMQMEAFKAVEKAMKTKAYSKEGLSAAAKLDPREQAKVEASEFLSSMVDELEQQVEALEAESETLQATMKKGKSNNPKADRIANIDAIIERHKWHQSKLELIRRSLDNGAVEAEQVTDLEESIRYYVTDGMNEEYPGDEDMYDDLALDEEEDAYGMNLDNEKGSSSQDNKSDTDEPIQEDKEAKLPPIGKPKTAVENAIPATARKPSAQTKSPLPALATLHTPLPTISNGPAAAANMKPASIPTRPAGEGLKYASAAAAAAANERNIGIAPLPPPPGLASRPSPSAANSPAFASIQPVSQQALNSPGPSLPRSVQPGTPGPQFTPKVVAASRTPVPPAQPTFLSESAEIAKLEPSRGISRLPPGLPPPPNLQPPITNDLPTPRPTQASTPSTTTSQPNGVSNGVKSAEAEAEAEEESIYHLPASLRDLVDSFEITQKRSTSITTPANLNMLTISQRTCPTTAELSAPRIYRPEMPVPFTGSEFPSEPLELLEDPRLYMRIDPDTLFYAFYYKQGTLQQFLASKALKFQSWRFHKQYQTWFQRHEEPKEITDEYELGAYRFFDYESTWMNRRKQEFKFHYRYLEDEQDAE